MHARNHVRGAVAYLLILKVGPEVLGTHNDGRTEGNGISKQLNAIHGVQGAHAFKAQLSVLGLAVAVTEGQSPGGRRKLSGND